MSSVDSRENAGSGITLGWIPYWNLKPLKVELSRLNKSGLKFVKGHPTTINRLLREGRIDLAPCSSVNLVKNPQAEMALPVGIASDGPVKSVYLALSKDLCFLHQALVERWQMLREVASATDDYHDLEVRQRAQALLRVSDSLPMPDMPIIPRMVLTPNSASGAMLAKIFYRLAFGEAAYQQFSEGLRSDESFSHSTNTMELVIGDEALVRRSSYHKVIDLGQWWRELTGLPFVFAVWQRLANKPVPISWKHRIYEATSLAQARMKIEPTAYLPQVSPTDSCGVDIDLSAYWKCLHYRLTDRDINGLILFLCLAREMLRPKADDSILVKMMRWHELTQQASPLS